MISRRDLTAVAAAAVVLPLASAATAVAVRAMRETEDSEHLVDPELLDFLKHPHPFDPYITDRDHKGRAVVTQEKTIPGLQGAPPVRILIVTPEGAGPARPGILVIHGGGFTAGSGLQILSGEVDNAVALGATLVSVDYRLAPATAFPGALDDNYAALTWLHGHAAELGVDPARIAVTGTSAGGGHAAMLSFRAAAAGGPPILIQVLIEPMLDDRTGSGTDPGPFNGQYVWTRDSNRKGWKALLGMPPGGPAVPSGSVPAREADLRGLPPTFIAVGSIDLFARESAAYAERLMQAGVQTELHILPGAYHGFELFVPESKVTRAMVGATRAALRSAFDREEKSGRG